MLPSALERSCLGVDRRDLVANFLFPHLRVVVVHGHHAALDDEAEQLGLGDGGADGCVGLLERIPMRLSVARHDGTHRDPL